MEKSSDKKPHITLYSWNKEEAVTQNACFFRGEESLNFRGEESLNFGDKREESSQEYQNSGGLAEMCSLKGFGSRSNMSAGGSHVHVGSLTTPLDYDDSDGLE